MRTLLALLLSTTICSAADLRLATKAPPMAPISTTWSGIYVYGYGDYGVDFSSMFTVIGPASVNVGALPHGGGIGGTVEALLEIPNSNWVLGLYGDMGWVNLNGSGNLANALMETNQVNYLGSVGAKVGYAFTPQVLGYLSGGMGFGGVKATTQVANLAAATSQTSVGWKLGGGFDFLLSPNWGLFIEQDYYQLGGQNVSIPNFGVTSSAPYNIALGKGGVFYKF